MHSIETINQSRLFFDPENPRLPAELHGADPEILAKYYYDYSVVDDLILSMSENSFFPHEPMIVQPIGDGNFKVVEGNRRLTALCIIHRRDEAKLIPPPSVSFTSDQLLELQDIPCVVSEDIAAMRRFIGFRHISGPLTWAPEAKARYIRDEISRAVGSGIPDPFRHVARAVGHRLSSIRDSFLALSLLEFARDEIDVNVSQIMSDRFGVWLRLISNPNFRSYIQLEGGTEYDQIVSAIKKVDKEKLKEVLSDLQSAPGSVPILRDSRNASGYGLVLENAAAHETLRRTGDLEAAMTIVAREGLADRILAEARRVDALGTEVKASEYNKETEEAAKRLFSSAASVRKQAAPLSEDELF